MKDTLFWTIVFILLAATAGWNILQNRQLRTEMAAAPSRAGQDQLLEVRGYELSHTGKTIKWPDGITMLGEDPIQGYEGYGLVLVVDDLSCDTCRDEQTQFALELAREVDPGLLRIVVNAENAMYARSYIRLNGIHEAVHFDKERRFFVANGIGSTPLLLLHNPQGEVIATHFPIPLRPEVSKPFHDFCQGFFGMKPIASVAQGD